MERANHTRKLYSPTAPAPPLRTREPSRGSSGHRCLPAGGPRSAYGHRSVGRLHGRVVNSGAYPIATFEATDVEGIRREFHKSIDAYIASCKEDGIEPRNPFSGKLNVRLGRISINALRARRRRAA